MSPSFFLVCLLKTLRPFPVSHRAPPLALCAFLVAAPLPLCAQQEKPLRAGGECPNGRISSVFIDNHSVFDLSDPDLDRRLEWAYRLANRLHVPTREDVIRREILLEEGHCYDPEMLRESERILRGSPFLADVDVFGVRQPDGSYHVIVDTRDDWSMRLQPEMKGGGLRLSGLELRDDNLLGYGRQVSAFYTHDWGERVYGFSYATPQLFETRWDASIAAGKTSTGHFFSQSLTYPFIGESGRWAGRQHILHSDQYFEYLVGTDSGLVSVLQPERRRAFDLGGVVRFGRRGNLTLVGAALTGEWIEYPSEPLLAEKGEQRAIPPDLLPSTMGVDSVASVRAMLLVGKRNIFFARRRGFETVRSTEDIRLGVEAEVGVGRSLPQWSSREDWAAEMGVFAGTQFRGNVITGSSLLLEAKRDQHPEAGTSAWRDIFGQLDAWAYWQPSPESHQTYVLAVAAAGGWNTTVPFQLTLGGVDALRGYPRQQDPGGQRLVASLEQRNYIGWPYPQLFDLGSVVSLDFGRVWAGDARYGVDSPFRANLGLGLRAALPPGSRQTFRVDVALPLQSGVSAGDVVFSVGVGQAIGFRAVRKDPQLLRSSRRGLTSSLFTYPY